MIYELVIEDNKAKSVLAFLKQLDFIKVKPVTKAIPASTQKGKEIDISYFGSFPDWDIDARELRLRGTKKRMNRW